VSQLTLADEIVARLRNEGLLRLQRDYTVADLREMTGYSRSRISEIKIHGEYYLAGKRLFRKEVVDYRRKMGLNLAEGK
jgi:hypothetical protein